MYSDIFWQGRHEDPQEQKFRKLTIPEVIDYFNENDGALIKYATPEQKDNLEVVKAAMKSYHLAFGYASENLKNNKEAVIEAVNVNGFNLGFASDDLKKDYDVVMAAVKNNGSAIQFALRELEYDPEIAKAAVMAGGKDHRGEPIINPEEGNINWRIGLPAQHIPVKVFVAHPEIAMESVRKNGFSLGYIPITVINYEICLEAVGRNGLAIDYVPEKFINREIVKLAIKNNFDSIKKLPPDLRSYINTHYKSKYGDSPFETTMDYDTVSKIMEFVDEYYGKAKGSKTTSEKPKSPAAPVTEKENQPQPGSEE